MQLHPPLDRLTLAEEEFCLLGDSPEIEVWNQHYTVMIDEYRAAMLWSDAKGQKDEGWIADTAYEVHKCLGTIENAAMTCDLGELAEGLLKECEQRVGRD